MLIWTLTVDSPDTGTIVTTVHTSEVDALATLRDHWFEEDGYAPALDANLPEYATETGYILYIEEHELNILSLPGGSE